MFRGKEKRLIFTLINVIMTRWTTGIKRLWKRWWNQRKMSTSRTNRLILFVNIFWKQWRKQYGWFWVCPNGGKNCHYRHALPPGYVLKSQMRALLEEETEKIAIEYEIENQRAKVTTSTPMTPELFMQWKKKKMAERDAGLASQMAERAKNDRMSGREPFLSDSSLFVDDAEAHEKYQRYQEPAVAEQKVSDNSSTDKPSDSTTAGGDAKVTDDDDDDELDIDELNELEASLSKVTIKEPGTTA